MLELHDEIPEIAGQKCEALLGQQYWYCGELTGDPNVLFLKLDDSWHRIFIDGGTVWRGEFSYSYSHRTPTCASASVPTLPLSSNN